MNAESNVNRVICPATKDPSVRMFIAAAILIGAGLWCFMDRGEYEKPEVWDLKNINKVAGYLVNHYAIYVAAPPGLVLAILGMLALKRKLIVDDTGIGYDGKKRRPWSEVAELDATELKTKGWITLHFSRGKAMKLDSWKLTHFRELIAFVEEKVPADKHKTHQAKET